MKSDNDLISVSLISSHQTLVPPSLFPSHPLEDAYSSDACDACDIRQAAREEQQRGDGDEDHALDDAGLPDDPAFKTGHESKRPDHRGEDAPERFQECRCLVDADQEYRIIQEEECDDKL